MSLTFKDLQDGVKRRATRDQGGTQFDTEVKTVINTSVLRVAREALWRTLRRTGSFETITTYTTGSGGGTFTNNSKNVTIVGATLITDNIKVGQKISLQGDTSIFHIKTITGETTLTLDKAYGGTTISGTGTYSILAQEEYNLPIQCSHRVFLWHNEYGYPFLMGYLPDHAFFASSIDSSIESVPTHYRMWTENMVIEQPLEASTISISSTSSSDTSIPVTVFGDVGGYPDSEIINTNASNGTTASAGSKSFTSIDRVSSGSSTVGRITATANSGNTTVAVIPAGDTTSGIFYRKVQLWPLPNAVMPIHVHYYKDPYRLVNDNDVHELGQDFDEAIILLSTAKIKYQDDQSEGDKFAALYKDEIRSLRKYNVDKIDWFPTLQRPFGRGNSNAHSRVSYSQFGSHFGPSVRH